MARGGLQGQLPPGNDSAPHLLPPRAQASPPVALSADTLCPPGGGPGCPQGRGFASRGFHGYFTPLLRTPRHWPGVGQAHPWTAQWAELEGLPREGRPPQEQGVVRGTKQGASRPWAPLVCANAGLAECSPCAKSSWQPIFVNKGQSEQCRSSLLSWQSGRDVLVLVLKVKTSWEGARWHCPRARAGSQVKALKVGQKVWISTLGAFVFVTGLDSQAPLPGSSNVPLPSSPREAEVTGPRGYP